MSEDTLPENRRKHPRSPLEMLIQYRCDTMEEFLSRYSLDLSPGGMFIRTDDPREEGELVFLQFYLNDGEKLIEGLGRVVRVNEPGGPATAGMGIEFVNFDEDSMTLIQEICGSRVGPKN